MRRTQSRYMLASAGLAAVLIAPGALAEKSSPSSPLWSQANQYYDPVEMAKAREELLAEGGSQRAWFVLFNQLEAQLGHNEDSFYWNGQASYGGDINKIWLKTEGKSSLEFGDVDDAEIQALYSRAISPFWNAQAGVRYDIEPDGLAHAVVALQGLAPYWFEVDASAFLSEKGDLTARTEFEYEFLLTQRLILQPRVEANWSLQDVPERDLDTGLNSIDAGVRLRYEIRREFAPYVGVEWQASFGRTADMIEAAGGKAEQTVLVAGVRTWF
ncbi:copper resistance protein B [Hyphomonas sp.]|uniref:copper resistance protein B n=1 Tax=Hyphomonas sp. TaxID=87 RepID=UPI003568C268